MSFKKIKLILVSLLISFLILPSVQAASVYLEPAQGEYSVGDNFGLNIKINTDVNECINVSEVTLLFPEDSIVLEDFSIGNSIFSLWIKKPTTKDVSSINNKGEIIFSGGIPGGYCGKIPGDPGESNILGKAIFNVIDKDLVADAFKYIDVELSPETRVLLNDGLGTDAFVKKTNARFKILAKSESKSEINEWKDELLSDKVLPESFVVELHSDNKIMEGKYFVIFSTVDKQTGIDHYEVLEIRSGEIAQDKITFRDIIYILFGKKKDLPPQWKMAESPYLLEDQDLTSIVKVKAVDKSGNERIIEYIPPEMEQKMYIAAERSVKLIMISWIVLIILILLIMSLVWWIIRRIRAKNEIK